MRINNRITGISGVTAGGLATIPLEVNRRYHTIKLKTFIDGAAADADDVIDMVRIKVNGVSIWEITAKMNLDLNASNNLDDATGELTLHFSDPSRADVVDEQMTAFDLFDERSFKIELVLKTPAASGVPRVEGIAWFDYERTYERDAAGAPILSRPVKSIIRRGYITQAVPAGSYDLTTLPIKDPILRLWLNGDQTITKVEVLSDSISIFESEVFENTRMLANYGIDATVFKFPVLFDFTNRLMDFLRVTRALNVKLTSAVGQNLVVLHETLTPDFR